jgi:hypothetical protein
MKYLSDDKMVDLIEQLGGYAKAKRELELKEQNSIFQCCTAISAEMIRDALPQYRRQHNIFEVGDHFVNHCDDCIYVVLSLNNGHMHGKSGDKNVWTYSGRFGVRHAESEEIQAGRRL